ncbi:MAG: hypothetical protein D8M58_22045 [Calditrichaeota bacterium]|nr:MAG: hypothetical protein DWQ03_11160 [Calditrichota bacterium]MBL1208095.1 hypothetical protein [Calditrichota bacterium]NOG47933.1 hypothetical protein [Calditrichota bacterium]
MSHRQFYLFFLTLFLINFLFSSEIYNPQIEDPILETWRWRHLNELDGKGVRCIEEDNNQVMWFGSDKGVISYNGLEWKIYGNEDGISGLPVFCVKAISDGRIIAGSSAGFSIWENQKWTPAFSDSAASGLIVNEIIELIDGTVLCATNYGLIHIKKNEQIFYFDQNGFDQFETIIPTNSLFLIDTSLTLKPRFNIASLVQGKNGNIWFATGYDNGRSGRIIKTRLGSDGNLKNFNVFHEESVKDKFFNGTHLFESESGTLWNIPEQFDQGLTRFSHGQSDVKTLSKLFGGDNVYTSIIQVSDGTIFMGGFGRFFTYKNNQWKLYQAPAIPVPSSNRILFFEDSRGDVWLAGKQNEVFLLEYSTKNWATYSNLNYQDQTKDGVTWFVDVYGKVVKKENDSWTAYGKEDGLMSHPVRVFISSHGQVWASGSDKGTACVAYLKNDYWIKKIFPQLSWGIDTRSVYEDFSGALWFGCNIDIQPKKGHLGGVIKLPDPQNNPGHFIQYRLPQKEMGVYGIGQSKDNKLWIAGVNGCYFDDEQWRPITDPKEFQYHTDCMFTSQDSILWVGSRNYGLFRYDGLEWTNFTMENGLSNNSITSIYASSDSLIWVSTAKGISRFDGNSWNNNIFPTELNIQKEGGEIRMGRDGTLWINNSSRDWNRRLLTGISVEKLIDSGFRVVFYHPDERAPETLVGRYEQEVSSTGNTSISWTGSDPYSKTSVENLQYSFRMDKGKWTSFSNENSNFFSELKPGDHLLEVRARDMDFNVDLSPLKIRFNVLYPFYLRPAFYIPIILLSVLSGLLLLRVIRRGREIRQAKKETDNILKNIEQGLFLLDHNNQLSSQYSEFLKKVFKEDSLTNLSLIELLKGKVSDDIIEGTVSFLEVMLLQDVDQQMLDDLNPLNQVKFEYQGSNESRFFSFRFRRIQLTGNAKNEHNLIVVVQDITEKITLGKKLEKAKEDADLQMNLMLSILNVEPGLLDEFLNNAENDISNISSVLENPNIYNNPKDSLEAIYRSVHSLKGNAGLLSLNVFADLAHSYEDKISELQKKEKLNSDDIIYLKDNMKNITKSLSDIHGLLDRISTIHNKMQTKSENNEKHLLKSLENLVRRVAKDEGKNAKLIYEGFQLQDIPKSNQKLIVDILIQLIKNSVAHGIESNDDRKKLKKDKVGKIELSSCKSDGEFGIIIRDDGYGLKLDKLRSKAIESGKFSNEEINNWSKELLADTIFTSGISTTDQANLSSGRGVGLDAVKEIVKSLHGKITVDFEEDEFCQFSVMFPTYQEGTHQEK